MKKMLITLALIGLSINSYAEQANEASVKQLMTLTGADQLGVQTINTMMAELKPLLPMASETFWNEVKQEATAEELINKVIPIYQKHLTQTEIEAAIAFYQTPVGKKLIATQPQIRKESTTAMQTWGKSLAKTIVKKYQAKYQVKQQ